MKRVLSSLIICLVAATGISASQAQDNEGRWYEVEIILFEHLDPVARDSEAWPIDPGAIDFEDTINLLPPSVWIEAPITEESLTEEPQTEALFNDAGFLELRILSDDPVPYQLLPADQHQLNDSYQRLVGSDNYLPLAHVAWRQAMPPRDQPDRIVLHDQLSSSNKNVLPPLRLPPEELQMEDELGQEEDLKIPSLQGVISLSIARYLHVETDFLLYRPLAEDASANYIVGQWQLPSTGHSVNKSYQLSPLLTVEEPEPEYFRVNGNLRLRSREVHYLDHPMLGMLILFTPVELPVAEEEPTEIEALPIVN